MLKTTKISMATFAALLSKSISIAAPDIRVLIGLMRKLPAQAPRELPKAHAQKSDVGLLTARRSR
jgi:hypothetical protein